MISAHETLAEILFLAILSSSTRTIWVAGQDPEAITAKVDGGARVTRTRNEFSKNDDKDLKINQTG